MRLQQAQLAADEEVFWQEQLVTVLQASASVAILQPGRQMQVSQFCSQQGKCKRVTLLQAANAQDEEQCLLQQSAAAIAHLAVRPNPSPIAFS